MTRKEIEAQYEIDKHGVIRTPGKFSREMLYGPYFYEMGLEAGSTEDVEHPDGMVSLFVLEADDFKEFPELEDVHAIALWETDQGFIILEHLESEKEYEDYMAKLERDIEKAEEEEEEED